MDCLTPSEGKSKLRKSSPKANALPWFFILKTARGLLPCRRNRFKTSPSMREIQGKKSVTNWRRVRDQIKRQNSDSEPFPFAAPDRRSGPYLSLLVQGCGRFPGLSCKVHSGKGLPRRQGGVVGRLFRHQGPYSSTEGSRSVLSALFSNRNCGGLERWLKL